MLELRFEVAPISNNHNITTFSLGGTYLHAGISNARVAAIAPESNPRSIVRVFIATAGKDYSVDLEMEGF
jgi:hypothetical protein